MAERGPNILSSPGLRVQKRLRKGTHSCTECRRRKVRCNFVPGTSSCFLCSSRGTRCVGQRDDTDNIARYENIASRNGQRNETDTIASDENIASRGASATSDIETPGSGIDRRAPFVSALENAEVKSSIVVEMHAEVQRTDRLLQLLSPANVAMDGTARPQTSWTSTTGTGNSCSPSVPDCSMEDINVPAIVSCVPQAPGRNSQSVCATLRSLLPGYDELVATMSKNGAWWGSFRQKTNILAPTSFEPLAAYAARTYTSSNPAELGILVAAYTRSVGHSHHLYGVVDSLILSNFTYAATMDGMECLILLAKSYTDIGQPRRAWFMWRRGMAIAQLMAWGLYHEGTRSPSKQRIWWSVYHGDRFASMLLGLPYAFNDAHFGATMHATVENSKGSPHHFTLRCAFIAGKVIDRNIVPDKPSLAKAIDLDEQMEAIAASMPEDWWDLPRELPNPASDLDNLTERLLQQYYFFHVRIYIHLPFMTKSAPTSYNISKFQCMESCRQLLKRYNILRTKIQGADLYECKTSDFVAFTATVALMIGLYGSSSKPSIQSSDKNLITAIVDIFFQDTRKKKCKLLSQCQKTIHFLRLLNNETQEMRIPYFGTVVRRPTQSFLGTTGGETHNHTPSVQTSQEATTSSIPAIPHDPFDSYSLDYFPNTTINPPLGSLHFGPNLFPNEQSQFDPMMVDIDQDWSLFLELDGVQIGGS